MIVPFGYNIGFPVGVGPFDCHFDQLGGTLAIASDLFGEVFTHKGQRLLERGPIRMLFVKLFIPGQSIGHHDHPLSLTL